MTLYAGDTVRVTNRATGSNHQPDDVGSVTTVIADIGGNAAPADMI